MSIPWTADLETGNITIDSEHKILIQHINNLADACKVGAGREKVVETAKFLLDYTKTHFRHEQDLMKLNSSYTKYDTHKQWHDQFTAKLADLTKNLNTKGADIALVANINTQAALLLSHIRTVDKDLARHIRESR